MMNIDNSYIIIRNNIPYLLNSFIDKYANRYSFNEKDERRDRELLLNKHEILKLSQKVKEKGLTIVCTKAYFKGNLLKIEIALARGKNLHDKRETIKKRDIERGMEHDIRRIY